MKKLLMMSVLSGSVAVANLTHAEVSQATHAKQGALFTTTSLVGAIVGGPLGFLAGAVGGAYLGEQIEKADSVTTMKDALATADNQAIHLQQDLTAMEQRQQQWLDMAMDMINTPVLFQTAADTLSDSGHKKIRSLATLLKAEPQLTVRLDGFADPRGTDEYNNVLSHYRATAVRDALVAAGVKQERIVVFSHGANRSVAAQGDLEAYARERRVEIGLSEAQNNTDVVMN